MGAQTRHEMAARNINQVKCHAVQTFLLCHPQIWTMFFLHLGTAHRQTPCSPIGSYCFWLSVAKKFDKILDNLKKWFFLLFFFFRQAGLLVWPLDSFEWTVEVGRSAPSLQLCGTQGGRGRLGCRRGGGESADWVGRGWGASSVAGFRALAAV